MVRGNKTVHDNKAVHDNKQTNRLSTFLNFHYILQYNVLRIGLVRGVLSLNLPLDALMVGLVCWMVSFNVP